MAEERKKKRIQLRGGGSAPSDMEIDSQPTSRPCLDLFAETEWVNDVQMQNILKVIIQKYSEICDSVNLLRLPPQSIESFFKDYILPHPHAKSLESKGVIVIPFCHLSHWILVIVDSRPLERIVYIWDPKGEPAPDELLKGLCQVFGGFTLVNECAQVQVDNYQCAIWVVVIFIRFLLHLGSKVKTQFRLENYTLGHFGIVKAKKDNTLIYRVNRDFARQVRNTFAAHLEKRALFGKSAYS